jgi:ribosomal protein S1
MNFDNANAKEGSRMRPWLTVLEDYRVGQDVRATVISWIEYGALLKLGTGVIGLLHMKEIDWISIEPQQVLRLGEEVEVRILSINSDKRRMNLSRRVLLPNPMDAFVKTAQVGKVYLGTVWKCEGYGAFVEIAPGVRGLLHNNEIGWDTAAKKGCTAGDIISVQIIGVDQVSRRIALGVETSNVSS